MDVIDLERDGPVFLLRMRAGENRINQAFLDEFHRALDEIEASDGRAALVTTGEGKFYSNGLDLEKFFPGGGDEPRRAMRDLHRLFARLLAFPTVTVAAINGHAFAGGAMLALAQDFRVMRSDRGYVCLPEIDLATGVPLTGGMYALLDARLSRSALHEMLISGRRYGAGEAVARGIVHEALAEAEVLSRAIEIAKGLAEKDRPTMGALKRGLFTTALRALERESSPLFMTRRTERAGREVPWWKTAVVYQIYPRSFADSNGDGVGDLVGILRRLDHLAWLGVDAVWLSPIFPSPMADFGYDVADYSDVDPLFGTLCDLDRLVAAAHARGIRVLLDWVPNHTSDRHPWFVESRRARTSPKRNWYWWRDPAPGGGPPNNWMAAFPLGTPAWTLDPETGQYYLHLFLSGQPDLNWSNPEVVEAMHATLRFWLDRGIDGFRVDVVHALGKDPSLPDDVPPWAGIPRTAFHEHPSTHAILRNLRCVVDSYPGDRMLVGEVWLLQERRTARYYGHGDELHLAFDLPGAVRTPWDAGAWRSYAKQLVGDVSAVGGWPTWVLSNHDTPRHRTRFGTEARARAAAVLLLTLPGTPFLFAGEELGLENAEVPPDRQVDPGGRDGCRAPIPWTPAPGHGWPGGAWLPFPPEPERRNVETLRAAPASILYLYRRLLAARKVSPALQMGDWRLQPTPEGVLAYERFTDRDRRVVLVNFTSADVRCVSSGTVEVASDGIGEEEPYPGLLGPDRAVLLRPE